MLPSGEVVIVSGPPGSGKSTVAALMAASADKAVHLEADWFFRMIRSGFIAPHLPESHAQNTAVTDVTTDSAAAYADAGYLVVWDGVVGPWFLDRIARRLSARGITLRYVVLRVDREVSLARVRERDGTIETSGAAVMWYQFADLGELESHVIDSSGGPEAVAARCEAALAGNGLTVSSEGWAR